MAFHTGNLSNWFMEHMELNLRSYVLDVPDMKYYVVTCIVMCSEFANQKFFRIFNLKILKLTNLVSRLFVQFCPGYISILENH